MPEQVKKYIDPLKARWDILTQPQRYKLLGVIAAVLIALALMGYFAFRTPWVTIMSGSNLQEISPMRAELANAGIRSRTAKFESELQVDSRRRADAISIMQVADVVPNRDHFTWADALDTNLSTTDAERRILEIRGKEGQVASQLTAMNGITGARVTFSIPNNRPFDPNPDVPTAAVVLNVTQGFSAGQGRNLARIVSQNVSNLNIEDVVIVDQYMNTIFSGEEEAQTSAEIAQQQQQQRRNSGMIETRQILSSVFDEVNVVFNPVFETRIAEVQTSQSFTTPEGGFEGAGLMTRDLTSRASTEGGDAALEPGIQPQTATFPNYLNPGNQRMSAERRDNDVEYVMNSVEVITETGPGGIDEARSTGSVMAVRNRNVHQEDWIYEGIALGEERTADDWRRYTNEASTPRLINSEIDGIEMEQYQQLVANAMGIPVGNISFMLMERIVPISTEIRVWDIPTILMVAVLLLLLAMLLYGLLRKQRTAGEDEEALEPQLAVEDLLVSTQLEEAREEAAQALEEIDYFKENEIKKQIDKFVNEKPEAVAALLRNWINVEEW
ncbi:MAG: hypothetical protein FWG87_02710 [Defluviitaleaceae bacterium]|nr:hypothetical protein [Defluviitaleaceae bacterium]